MKVTAIVSEYNPFHKGHKYQIDQLKSISDTTHVVSIMSGQFVQRGEPAIYDKWTRAEIALKNGVDLVIELPTFFAISSAEYFAKGAIQLLDYTNVIDYISFGTEINNIQLLKKIAYTISSETSDFSLFLKEELSKGLAFPKARINAIKKILPEEDLSPIMHPNSILATEYLKALYNLNSTIETIPIQRIGADYHNTNICENYPSATAIRKDLEKYVYKDFISDYTSPKYLKDFDQLILYALKMMPTENLGRIYDVSEGIEYLIKKHLPYVTSTEALIDKCQTKRYAKGRIKRILIASLLNIEQGLIDASQMKENCYIRVLGFNEKGQEILKRMKKTSEIPIITNINKTDSSIKNSPLLRLDCLATDIYNMPNYDNSTKFLSDFTHPIIHVKE